MTSPATARRQSTSAPSWLAVREHDGVHRGLEPTHRDLGRRPRLAKTTGEPAHVRLELAECVALSHAEGVILERGQVHLFRYRARQTRLLGDRMRVADRLRRASQQRDTPLSTAEQAVVPLPSLSAAWGSLRHLGLGRRAGCEQPRDKSSATTRAETRTRRSR
jgi:hypothetical protein